MPRHTLFVYVDGSDLDDVVDAILARLEEFVAATDWSRPTWVVNQRHPRDPSMRPEDLTDWDLGVNHELPNPSAETEGWFDEVERILVSMDSIAASTARSFVVGLANNENGLGEDFYSLDGGGVDLDGFRRFLGLGGESPRLL